VVAQTEEERARAAGIEVSEIIVLGMSVDKRRAAGLMSGSGVNVGV
jgi:hypothetical protein